MKNIFQTLFKKKQSAEPAPQTPAPNSKLDGTADQGANAKSENNVRRELTQVLLRDALRRHGIPPQWIELQMMLAPSASRGTGMYVRLVVKQWDARLMRYAYAFGKVLQQDINRMEPKSKDWLRGVVWQLDAAQDCPYDTMPDKAVWKQELPKPEALGPIAQPSPAVAFAASAPAHNTGAFAAVTPSPAASPMKPVPFGVPAGVPISQGKPTQPAFDAKSAAREELDRLFLAQDAARAKNPDGAQSTFAATEPSPLR